MGYLKLGGLLGIVLFVAGLFWYFHGVEEKKDGLIRDNAVQGTVIKGQEKTIETDTVVADTKEVTGSVVAAETTQKVSDQKKIVKKAEQREVVIKDHFEQLPATPENVQEQQQQLSSTRIDSLWESYCLGVPDATECKAPQPVIPQGA